MARMSEEYRSYRGLIEVRVLCTHTLPRCSDKRHACFCLCAHDTFVIHLWCVGFCLFLLMWKGSRGGVPTSVEGGGVEGQRVDGGDKVPSKDCTRSPDWVRACGSAIMRAYRASNHAACTQDVTESGSCSLLSVRVCVCKLHVRWFPDACIRISTDAGRWALCVLCC